MFEGPEAVATVNRQQCPGVGDLCPAVLGSGGLDVPVTQDSRGQGSVAREGGRGGC